ncbi:hypothetical protein QR77_21015 [Streptomyces sp. 150FB]|uniref:hypothetical protein n=1 Tax=Streptomyces sp. 150FB TaxID=1576605 RepID=UPI0005895BEA|nr:hypothetical protein [Streptomyces sp. 150FB]KIF75702.1 hypothetical protein QR77_21015 [Streptomyces sp. 150FB]
MTNTDPYGLIGATGTPDGPPPDAQRAGVVRPLLWVLLVISAAGNMVASYGAAGTSVHLACGVVTALCVVALVTLRLRGRR